MPKINYDKTENTTTLLNPAFWSRFDYALIEEPGLAVGAWEIVDTVWAYASIEILRPGDVVEGSVFTGNKFEKKSDATEGVGDLEKIYEAVNCTGIENQHEERGSKTGDGLLPSSHTTNPKSTLSMLKARISNGHITKFEVLSLLRDLVRSFTGGWWIGPRMEPRVRILRNLAREM